MIDDEAAAVHPPQVTNALASARSVVTPLGGTEIRRMAILPPNEPASGALLQSVARTTISSSSPWFGWVSTACSPRDQITTHAQAILRRGREEDNRAENKLTQLASSSSMGRNEGVQTINFDASEGKVTCGFMTPIRKASTPSAICVSLEQPVRIA
ncbi:hypothetical protein KFK09_004867 [Dendrobium nobile]|uniref:Uncharacterized protein n=1 Tax=Dendrobium nobile TaxID=94219 RepID=A0A8T3BXJ5_DENNO|nr:hypothetical protein KFK09_004867 [Dendrobium nobile]